MTLQIRNLGVLEVVGWSVIHSGRCGPRKDPVATVQDAGFASGPVSTGMKISPPAEFDPLTVQPSGCPCPD
jgi:hypothetical protein